MYVGTNLPYDWYEKKDQELDQITLLDPEILVVMSHTPNIEDLINWYPGCQIWVIRAKTGPSNLGVYPDNISNYKEWESEQSLAECIQVFVNAGITPYVVLGNEPDIEMASEPDQSENWHYDSGTYAEWYSENYYVLNQLFGGSIRVGPAALSQGNPERFAKWSEIYPGLAYDFLTEHLYIGEPAEDWQLRYEKFPRNKKLLVTEFNDNGTGRTSTLYADTANWLESRDANIFGLAFFTIEGGGNTRENRPEWWFLTDAEIEDLAFRAYHYNAEFDLRDPYATHEEKGMEVLDGFIQLWQLNAPVTYWVGEDYSGIFKVWSRNPDIYGSPVADEFTTQDGRVIQTFTRGVYEYSNATLVKVVSEI